MMTLSLSETTKVILNIASKRLCLQALSVRGTISKQILLLIWGNNRQSRLDASELKALKGPQSPVGNPYMIFFVDACTT